MKIFYVYYMKRIHKVLDYKERVPPNVKLALSKIGDTTIVSARLGRTPVQKMIQEVLEAVAEVDELYHLFMELTLDNGQVWCLEKIDRINLVKQNRSNKKEVEFLPSFSVDKTVHELFTNTQTHMGDDFLPYKSANNNCQVFIMGILDANGFNTSERTAFVKQDTKHLFENTTFRKFANTITDIGGYTNTIIDRF